MSTIFWVFKSKLQAVHAVTYITLFLLGPNNCFFICLLPYIPICFYYFHILCFYSHLLFTTLLATRIIIQFTILDSISLQPAHNITKIKKYLIAHYERESVARDNYNQSTQRSNIFVVLSMEFSFLDFISCSHKILMNFLSTNYCNYFVTKRSLNNTSYRKFSLNFK